MMKYSLISILFFLWAIVCPAKEYHVSINGNDAAKGSKKEPFKTINAAAQKALPGDTVTVHEGVYREWVDPLTGGSSKACMILYRAAEGETVEVKGSELLSGWKKLSSSGKTLWTVKVPNTLFGSNNPFAEKYEGDWLFTTFDQHLADIYLNDVSMYEAESIDSLCVSRKSHRDHEGSRLNWYAEIDGDYTVIYANFGGLNPNRETVEVSVRPTCFYPSREGVNFITVRGFVFSQAATRWAAPTAEQVGMVSTHWSKGWIIEDNIIKNSKSAGITLGKEAGTGQNVWMHNPQIDGSVHYLECIFRTLRHGWNKENIGSHIVRNNTISDCGQAGICGSMGCAFSEIYGNHIYNINVKDQFTGCEQAGIKLHGGIDVYIHNNCIHNSNRGVWLDWMGQGARVSSNLFFENFVQDFYFEVNHGPYLVDNNIMLSEQSLWDMSEGGAFVHNYFGGEINCSLWNDPRYVPYNVEHSTEVKGICTIDHSDNRMLNNIIAIKEESEDPLAPYSSCPIKGVVEDNVYVVKPSVEVIKEADSYSLVFKGLSIVKNCRGVDGARLGRTRLSGYAYENADGTSVNINKDYSGNLRSSQSCFPGPFELVSEGIAQIKFVVSNSKKTSY